MLPLQEAPSPPTSGPKQCGIGCNINTNEHGELFVTKVIPGGPAAFSCNVAVEDVILCVDGVSVVGETVDDVKRRIVGPEGIPIEVTLRHKRHSGEVKEHVVRLLRQPPVPFPERLSEGPIGLGLDLERMDDGSLVVRKLQNGGAASLSNQIRVGDKIVLVDGIRMNDVGQPRDFSSILKGRPFSRVSLGIVSNGILRNVEIVRTVVLMGEFLIKFNSYQSALNHAIVEPPPPRRDPAVFIPELFQKHEKSPANSSSYGLDEYSRQNLQPGMGVRRYRAPARQDLSAIQGDDIRSETRHGAAICHEEYRGEHVHTAFRPLIARGGIQETSPGVADILTPHVSFSSRDSIASIVRQQFGDQVDGIRTVEGRENSFLYSWPHSHVPKLSKSAMAQAGFVFAPDSECPDKVLCVFCGLELAYWEEGDDPWVAHHDASPGCSFWRKSSSAGERLSKEMFTGYGSPYHSIFFSPGVERSLGNFNFRGTDRLIVT